MLRMLAAPRPVVGAAAACLGIRFCVGCALIIPMIIQTILLIRLEPSRPTMQAT
jgi:hypothetical protein